MASAAVLLIPLLTGLFGIPIKIAIGASIVSVIAIVGRRRRVCRPRAQPHTPGNGARNRNHCSARWPAASPRCCSAQTCWRACSRSCSSMWSIVCAASKARRRHRPDWCFEHQLHRHGDRRDVSYGVHNLSLVCGAALSGWQYLGAAWDRRRDHQGANHEPGDGLASRAAIATSNFMIGVTAATSAVIYYQRGFLDLNIAIPTALGVLAGAQIGTRIGGRVRSHTLKLIFQGLLLIFAAQMIYQAVTG
ncbi:MAG: sulfite exporter TauE/SafE family protein [Kouleothrix sp.]